ncbi:hypothetical protein BDU57DRAFT_509495 [Ampelomyces quisqualis]|uniref:Uncharacterized protein n=1 Tax=Ampelomyces quisqualis TaxID=50730 RepID=A0A6A5R1G6_AMPQU|nr:hypothetical protein BDU57DRAFT_509495 [Ampelomyces quisqualis]
MRAYVLQMAAPIRLHKYCSLARPTKNRRNSKDVIEKICSYFWNTKLVLLAVCHLG